MGNIPPTIAKIAPDGQLTPRQRRKLLLEMSLRRQKPGTGSSLAFLKRRTAMNEWPDLRQTLSEIPWAVIGGVATRAYMPERMTKDLDVLVKIEDEEQVVALLIKAGFKFISRLTIPDNLFESPTGVEIDVLLGDMPWINEALSQPERDPAGFPVLGLPYLVLMKLQASRSQDWTDVSRMLITADAEQLNNVRKIVAQYSPEDQEDLETLIYLGKLEAGTIED